MLGFGYPYRDRDFIPPPPYNRAWRLMEERREIIMAALRGGLPYEEGLKAADGEIPLDMVAEANAEYNTRKAAYLAKYPPYSEDGFRALVDGD